MAFYYIFPIIVLTLGFLGRKSPNVGKILFLILLFFSMFRGDNVGTDTIHYIDLGAEGDRKLQLFLDNGGVKFRFELAFYFLFYIVYALDLNPRLVIFIFSILTFVFLYLSARRLRISVALVAVFFVFGGYYYYSFNISRQFVASCIALYGVTFLQEVTPKKYLFFLWIIIGFLFHNSVIAFLVLYPLKYLHFRRNVIAIITLVLYIVISALPTFNIIQGILSDSGITFLEKYGRDGVYATSSKNFIGKLMDFIYVCLLVFIYKYRNKEGRTDIIDNILLFTIFLMALFSSGNLGAWRLLMMFTSFHCFYLASVFENKMKAMYPLFFVLLSYEYYVTVQIDSGVYYLQFL